MATVTKSIGATGRDYSTIAAWEADLDNSGIYSAGDVAIGECYDDAVFVENGTTLNGGGTIGLSAWTLQGAEGHRHEGTPGTGARIQRGVNGSYILRISNPNSVYATVAWLEGDCNGMAVNLPFGVGGGSGQPALQHHLLAYGQSGAFGSAPMFFQGGSTRNIDVVRCLGFRMSNVTNSAVQAIGIQQAKRCYGNTIYGIVRDLGTGEILGIQSVNNSAFEVKNNIVAGLTGTSTGTKDCFASHGALTVTVTNASDDATAPGAGSLTGITASDQFVSTVWGSEDLHLKSGADCIDAGTDLGTTYGVNLDIDGRDLDAEGDTWDIGADEYVAEGGGPVEKTVSETLAVQISEAALLSGTLARTDALSARLDEAASVAATLARSDTLAILLSEVAALLGTYVTADTLAVWFDDAPVLLALVGPVIDTLAPTLTEGAGQVVVALTVSDGLTPRLDEATPGLLVQVTRSDTAAVVLSEATGLGAVLAASDTLRARLDDVAAIAATLTAIDTLPVRLDDTVGTAVLITASDVLAPRLDEGPPSLLVSLQRIDSLGVSLTEGVILDVALSRADGLAVTLTEAATITAALTAQDWLALELGETVTKLVLGELPGPDVVNLAATLRRDVALAASLRRQVPITVTIRRIVDLHGER